MDDALERLGPVPVEVEGQLDHRTVTMRELLDLECGSLLQLDRSAGENIDIFVGGSLVGYGEVVVMENRFCIRVTDFREDE